MAIEDRRRYRSQNKTADVRDDDAHIEEDDVQHGRVQAGGHEKAATGAAGAHIKAADLYRKALQARGHRRAGVATAGDSAGGREAIRGFNKSGSRAAVGILVPVAWAYEGLDNPPFAHASCLTNITSYPW